MNSKDLCLLAPVIPVLVIDDVATAKPLAEALVKGGLPVLEVTLRTACALEAIKAMSEVEGGVVGAGTVNTPADVIAAKQAGAKFLVSPGTTASLIASVKESGLPLLPGAATASEVMYLMEQGFETLKFFPAEAAGGVPMLKSWQGPLASVGFCPTGGVSPSNAEEYLALPNVLCVGGSWVAPSNLIKAGDWDGITELARVASQLGR